MKLLVLDNYDSFTYNLVHLIEKVSDIPFSVFRNDEIALKDINAFDKILLSPGPGLPSDAGVMPQLLKTYHSHKSILGVCLGLQGIGELYGYRLKNLPVVFHGMATPINVLQQDPLFNTIPQRFMGGRYHSWVIDETDSANELTVTAVDDSGCIMAASHRTDDVKGVQFHPESILSEFGEQIIRNWLTG
jgi:anthranilate synthase component 2